MCGQLSSNWLAALHKFGLSPIHAVYGWWVVGEPVTVCVWLRWGCVVRVVRAAREVLPFLFAQSGGAQFCGCTQTCTTLVQVRVLLSSTLIHEKLRRTAAGDDVTKIACMLLRRVFVDTWSATACEKGRGAYCLPLYRQLIIGSRECCRVSCVPSFVCRVPATLVAGFSLRPYHTVSNWVLGCLGVVGPCEVLLKAVSVNLTSPI